MKSKKKAFVVNLHFIELPNTNNNIAMMPVYALLHLVLLWIEKVASN